MSVSFTSKPKIQNSKRYQTKLNIRAVQLYHNLQLTNQDQCSESVLAKIKTDETLPSANSHLQHTEARLKVLVHFCLGS